MWIINNNEATARLSESWMKDLVDDVVEDLPGDSRGVVFDGPVNVKREVGEQLIERHKSITRHETNE